MPTRYFDCFAVAQLVNAVGLLPFLDRLTACLEEDYGRWTEFQRTERYAAHHKDGVIELMPTTDGKLWGCKYVNGHPANPGRNLMTVVAFGILSEMASGYPLMIADMTYLTALRTAATSALVARRLARPDSRVMAMIGNGCQSEFQCLAFHHLLGVDEIRAYDVDSRATAKLVDNLAGTPGLRVAPARSTREAVAGADIVTTCTADKRAATILTPDMIEPGMHLNAIGGDCPGKTELDPQILLDAARVVVEYEPQTRIEGDIQRCPKDFPVTEIWEILAGAKPGRAGPDEVTVYDSVGFALEDFSALRCLYRLAGDGGGRLEIFPKPADVKNLFGHGFGAAALRLAKAV